MDHMTFDMREKARELARQHQRRAEQATKRLLGQWISGLEPTVAYDQEYRVIGISYGGRIVLSVTE